VHVVSARGVQMQGRGGRAGARFGARNAYDQRFGGRGGSADLRDKGHSVIGRESGGFGASWGGALCVSVRWA
jgi:hypothetical protein